jgi:hypothetical protein
MCRCVVLAMSTVFLVVASSTAAAQAVWAGAAAQIDAQRFPQDVVPNRLDGSAGGWNLFGGGEPWRHIAVDLEWTADRIHDSQSLSLTIDGRPVTIQSTLSHRTRIVPILCGFTHALGTRWRISYLGGAGWMKVERTFTTDAPGTVLRVPSDLPGPTTTLTVDRSVVPVAGIDAMVRLWRHVSGFGGARVHPLAIEPADMSGVSIRFMAGGAWVF